LESFDGVTPRRPAASSMTALDSACGVLAVWVAAIAAPPPARAATATAAPMMPRRVFEVVRERVLVIAGDSFGLWWQTEL
jgi:uncharacterized membrane protein YedE/YeeE